MLNDPVGCKTILTICEAICLQKNNSGSLVNKIIFFLHNFSRHKVESLWLP